MVRAAAPAASVINVASMYGIVASRTPMAAYNATKGALINLTRHLAVQWGDHGVRVNALAPGYFPTELTAHLADVAFAPDPSRHRRGIHDRGVPWFPLPARRCLLTGRAPDLRRRPQGGCARQLDTRGFRARPTAA